MSRQIRIMPNWKAPGRDGVQGVCIKNLTSLLSRIAEQLDRVLDGSDKTPQGKIPLVVLDQYTAFPLCGS